MLLRLADLFYDGWVSWGPGLYRWTRGGAEAKGGVNPLHREATNSFAGPSFNSRFDCEFWWVCCGWSSNWLWFRVSRLHSAVVVRSLWLHKSSRRSVQLWRPTASHNLIQHTLNSKTCLPSAFSSFSLNKRKSISINLKGDIVLTWSQAYELCEALDHL